MAFFGEHDFSMMPEHTGDFGIGVKRVYTDKLKHILHVFYPIDKVKW
jgi:hypothetical protein